MLPKHQKLANKAREESGASPRLGHDAESFSRYQVNAIAFGLDPVGYKMYNKFRKAHGDDWEDYDFIPVKRV